MMIFGGQSENVSNIMVVLQGQSVNVLKRDDPYMTSTVLHVKKAL